LNRKGKGGDLLGYGPQVRGKRKEGSRKRAEKEMKKRESCGLEVLKGRIQKRKQVFVRVLQKIFGG